MARKQKITNDSEDGEPERKKCATSQKSEVVRKESSERNGIHPEADGYRSSTSPEPRNIQLLPSEVLEIIFSLLTSTRSHTGSHWSCMNLRLVCKQWCDVYDYIPNTNTKVYFTQFVPSVHFENCGFRRFAVQFCQLDLGELPHSMWQKIGHRIHSISLKCCIIGDKGLKNLIRHCCNLQVLKVVLNGDEDSEDFFCSPKMLKELHITQKNLKTFAIINRKKFINVTNWIEIFRAFLEIFPNVFQYTVGYRDVFRFRFVKELGENDVNEIATSLAFSLSTDGSHHRQALDATSTLRLEDISLYWRHDENEVGATLFKFFSNCNNLKFIKVNLAQVISHHILKTLFLQILTHCSNLRILRYWYDIYGERYRYKSSETEFAELLTMCPNLEELSTHNFNILINHSSLSYSKKYKPFPWIEISLKGIVKTYPHLQHLNVERSSCTDEMLQNIFKHLVNLRTLSVKITYENTDAGITGRRSNLYCTSIRNILLFGYPTCNIPTTRSTTGYSISHLKNLEELKFFGYCNSRLSDEIFYEFKFSKLHYLRIDRPEDPIKVLPIMGKSMPLLKTICFTNLHHRSYLARRNPWNWNQSLVPFCQPMKKLLTMILPHTTLCANDDPTLEQCMPLTNVVSVFKACPSLRFIEGNWGTCARYLPDTQEVILTDHEGKLNHFFTLNDYK